MEQVITKSIYQIVGNGVCVEAEDGLKVSSIVRDFIQNKRKIELSFLNVTIITSAFLNTAIGVLYKDFSESEIKQCLSVKDMDSTDAFLLKRVVDTAKIFYSDPDRIKNSLKEVLGE